MVRLRTVLPQSGYRTGWGADAQKAFVSVRKSSGQPWEPCGHGEGAGSWCNIAPISRGFRRAALSHSPELPKLSSLRGCKSMDAFSALTAPKKIENWANVQNSAGSIRADFRLRCVTPCHFDSSIFSMLIAEMRIVPPGTSCEAERVPRST